MASPGPGTPVGDYIFTFKSASLSPITIFSAQEPVLASETIDDEYFRDLPSVNPVLNGTGTAFIVHALLSSQTVITSISDPQGLAAGPTEKSLAAVTGDLIPDDWQHADLRQITFKQSFWHFYDKNGKLIGFFPWDAGYISNAAASV